MVLPFIFNTTPAGNVPASELDTNFTFLESQGVQGLTTTGSSPAYIATPADAWVIGYSNYIARALTIIPNFSNVGASTVNVSGLGNASIYKNSNGISTSLANNDLKQNIPAILICDGTGFLLANPSNSPNVLQVSTGNPTGNSTSTRLMMGLGSTAIFTPRTTGIAYFQINANIGNTTTGGAVALLRYGTGTAPANGAAETGTAVEGQPTVISPSVAGFLNNFTAAGVVTGLTPGTQYWIDMALSNDGSGTASLGNINISAFEIK